MQSQWALQKQILARYRSLGIVGQLPGFQGNVPIGMKNALKDSNMTDNKKGTAWMDALDPNFAKVADVWMKVLVEDFGTDHWCAYSSCSQRLLRPAHSPSPVLSRLQINSTATSMGKPRRGSRSTDVQQRRQGL
jgi:hypothetical protein